MRPPAKHQLTQIRDIPSLISEQDDRSIFHAIRTSTDGDYFVYIRATKRVTDGVQVKYDAIFLLNSITELDIPTYQENTSKNSFVSRKDRLSWGNNKKRNCYTSETNTLLPQRFWEQRR
ncbi:hypothetical protein Fot_11698 [Forsythia ovata]|uniref:Uncharacterized protein n=1 Tax=Forsythia ovata TaxID=205694 RepID=A0ABD1WKG6_9LAMI